MYNDLINALRHCAECDHQGCAADCRFGKEHPLNFICIDYLQQEAADAIEELRAKADLYKEVVEEYRRVNMMLIDKFPQWIPVTERLPGLHEEVLVCNEEYGLSELGFAMVAVWDGADWIETWEKREAIHCVTHWMPLPEPPKEES